MQSRSKRNSRRKIIKITVSALVLICLYKGYCKWTEYENMKYVPDKDLGDKVIIYTPYGELMRTYSSYIHVEKDGTVLYKSDIRKETLGKQTQIKIVKENW